MPVKGLKEIKKSADRIQTRIEKALKIIEDVQDEMENLRLSANAVESTINTRPDDLDALEKVFTNFTKSSTTEMNNIGSMLSSIHQDARETDREIRKVVKSSDFTSSHTASAQSILNDTLFKAKV